MIRPNSFSRSRTTWTICLLLGIVAFMACKKDPDPEPDADPADPLAGLVLPTTPFNYSDVDLPAHFLTNDFPPGYIFQFAAIESDNTPADNLTTDDGATLGRVLFYEKKLSANGTIACASCHSQELGFSDDATLSLGFEGGETRRHSMGLSNARFYQSGKFFWDERAATLEDQVLMPFQDEVEMGLTLEQVVQIVQDQSYTPILFENAFGDAEVTAERVAQALAQFVRSMVSFTSKYDEGRVMVSSPLDDFPNFTTEENLGKTMFHSQSLAAPSCNSCHLSEAFVAPLLAENATTSGTNNGLDLESIDDLGIFESTGVNGHRGKFKVPSLRNIALRAPYMHDARFENLEAVIDHYSTGIQNHTTLQPLLLDDNDLPIQYNFTEVEKSALIAFLTTLTDDPFIVDEKFSDPFE